MNRLALMLLKNLHRLPRAFGKLWHYRFAHEGWEYDGAVSELHACKPEGVEDPYTPNGIADPRKPDESADVFDDHTFSSTWHTSYPEKMRRVDKPCGSWEGEK